MVEALPLRFRQVFVAFTLRLPPARRALYIGALVFAIVGVIKLYRGFATVDLPLGTPFIQVPVYSRPGPMGPSPCWSACSWSTCWCCWKWQTGCR